MRSATSRRKRPGARNVGVSGSSDDLGIEWDLGGRLNWSKALAFDAWLGVLIGSGVLEEFTLGGHDATFLIGFGARLQF